MLVYIYDSSGSELIKEEMSIADFGDTVKSFLEGVMYKAKVKARNKKEEHYIKHTLQHIDIELI